MVHVLQTPKISIHALLAESDLILAMARLMELLFLSTLSLRRATIRPYQRHFAANISIHALLAESDNNVLPAYAACGDFYPRSPCGERRGPSLRGLKQRHFYPRSPCGERPVDHKRACIFAGYFYPRSPCGERPNTSKKERMLTDISIHALLAESDLYTT